MNVGILTKYDEKKIEEMNKENKPVFLGFEVQSILDEINLLEVKYKGDAFRVLSKLKASVMIVLGKIQVPKEDEKEGE